MKFFIAFYIATAFIISQAWAVPSLPPTTTKGVNDTVTQTTFNIRVPNSTKTSLGGTTALLETGNYNLLVNPSFEYSGTGNFYNGWTANTTNATPTKNTTGNEDGLQSFGDVFIAGTFSADMISQTITPVQSFVGVNMEATMFIQTSTLFSASGHTLSYCLDIAGANYQCVSIVDRGTAWQQYTINFPGAAASTAYKIYVKDVASSGTTLVLSYDNAYLGPARNIASGIPPNTFTAQISSTGVISSQSPSGWLSSCSTGTGTINCVPTAGNFSVAPNCIPAPNTAGGSGYSVGYVTSSATASSLPFALTSGGSTSNAFGIIISCQKAPNDFVQNAITPNLLPQYWSGYMTGTGWTSTSTSGYVDMAAGSSISVVTNQSRNMTCTAASGSLPGITCTPNVTGIYYACASFPSSSSSAASVFARLLESVSNVKVNDGNYGDVAANSSLPFGLCGLFTTTAGTAFTLKIQSYSSAGTTTLKTTSASFPLSFTVAQWSGGVTAPWLLGSVTSNATGALRVEDLVFGGSGASLTSRVACTTSTCTTVYNTGAYGVVTRTGTGAYSIPTTAFPNGAECNCNTSQTSAYTSCGIVSVSSSAIVIGSGVPGTATDDQIHLTCRGPR